jgi:hypothetical protein
MEKNIIPVGDLEIKDEGQFWGHKVTPVTDAGKEFAYQYNRKLHVKCFSVMYANIDGFINLALKSGLTIDTIVS